MHYGIHCTQQAHALLLFCQANWNHAHTHTSLAHTHQAPSPQRASVRLHAGRPPQEPVLRALLQLLLVAAAVARVSVSLAWHRTQLWHAVGVRGRCWRQLECCDGRCQRCLALLLRGGIEDVLHCLGHLGGDKGQRQ